MKRSELQFEFPLDLIAREPQRPSRIASACGVVPIELDWTTFLQQFQSGDVLVLNDTKVLKRRIFTAGGLEILFLKRAGLNRWEVLFPSRRFKIGDSIDLPGHRKMVLVQKGRPQIVETDTDLDDKYFEDFGELPLPPYIQKAREARHTRAADSAWYQTAWSSKPGSFAAPTASLHFTEDHLKNLKARGVEIHTITLHVGLGTFLPIEVENLADHSMHSEDVTISKSVITALHQCQARGQKVWAMGTTVARALESHAAGLLHEGENDFGGSTQLLILPGFRFQYVDRLLTNFHQPESTLLALVMAFAGREKTMEVYKWAIKNKFRLFSYGDLSIWKRE